MNIKQGFAVIDRDGGQSIESVQAAFSQNHQNIFLSACVQTASAKQRTIRGKIMCSTCDACSECIQSKHFPVRQECVFACCVSSAAGIGS
jgi:hypothetical protein